jgi:hypothetical protein
MENTSTKGRMPTIRFSDSADYDTLLSLVHEWCYVIVTKDGRRQAVDHLGGDDDQIGGSTWDEEKQDWSGEVKWFDLDEVEELIIL